MRLQVRIPSRARADRKACSASRAAERRLRSELATYSSHADRIELDAILDRHAPADADPVRALLA